MSKSGEKTSSQDMARDRTDWAEDRNVLVNERIFAGRMRTGMISVGMGLTVLAVLGSTAPEWLSKTVASVFILLGIAIFYGSWSACCQSLERLSEHTVEAVPRSRFSLISGALTIGSMAVAAVVWLT